LNTEKPSDVLVESVSVLELDSSSYFEDSDLDSELNPLDSDSNLRTRSWTRGIQDLDSALYDLELIN